MEKSMTHERLRSAVESLAERLLGQHGIISISGEELIVVMVEGDADAATKTVPPLHDGYRTKVVSTQGLELHRHTLSLDADLPNAVELEGVLRCRNWPVTPNPSLWLETPGRSMSAQAVLSGAGGRMVGRRIRVTVEAIDEASKPSPGAAILELLAHPFEIEHTCPECGSAMRRPVSLWRCARDHAHTMVGPEIALEMRTTAEEPNSEAGGKTTP
jgi:hypothetical protein